MEPNNIHRTEELVQHAMLLITQTDKSITCIFQSFNVPDGTYLVACNRSASVLSFSGLRFQELCNTNRSQQPKVGL